MDELAKRTMAALTRNGFKASFFETAEEAKRALIDSIDAHETVAMGGSMTIKEMGIKEALALKGIELLAHIDAASFEERVEILRKAAVTDVYLSSINALTADGMLLNTDGLGNRVASGIFGHRRVCYIAGVNKIVRNLQEALIRIKNVAAPLNAKRLNKHTPCAVTGKCENCNAGERLCRATVILERPLTGVGSAEIAVFLVNERLGY
ncbi:MAG: lactate utilization protein [Clostridiales Family XIII bacterium]|jgi:L-lactate utilization protein LutB|nr:lactate utilization protein [Clostridiales Family XIII bacterium]